MSTGIVSATAGIRDDETRLQFSAPVQPGNSGGALLNRRGHVIGVVQSVLNPISQGGQVFIPQNVNFAIKAFVLRSALRQRGLGALGAGDEWPSTLLQELAGSPNSNMGEVTTVSMKYSSRETTLPTHARLDITEG